MTLCKPDFQKFMKRLRKRMPEDLRLKYYCCGEYGSRNWRPHYHLLLFNFPLSGQPLHDFVEDVWSLGEVHVGDVTPASIDYTLKYMCKPSRVPLHRNDTRIPEFSLMSKGLGLSYLTSEVIEWHNANVERAYIVRPGGVKISIPRYYKNRIFRMRYVISRLLFFTIKPGMMNLSVKWIMNVRMVLWTIISRISMPG